MTTSILPSLNEDYGFVGAITRCPLRDRRSTEVWTLAARHVAEAIGADSEDEMIGIRDFLDSRMGRQFADDVIGALQAGAETSDDAIAAAIATWQGWRIGRATERDDGIPAGLPYLTGWVQHFAITASMADAD
jgi:hypothetical protein